MAEQTAGQSTVGQPDAALISQLDEACLDVDYWVEALKTHCGITKYGQLKFLNEPELKTLQKVVRFDWEKNALRELVGITVVPRSTQRKIEGKEVEKTAKVLDELRLLGKEGKTRADIEIQEKVEQLRQVLEIPESAWIKSVKRVSIDDLVERFSNQLDEIRELAVSRSEWSPTELVEKASGGLALKGLLLTKEATGQCMVLRKTVLETPTILPLKSPISIQKEDVLELSSQTQSNTFNKVLDTMGHRLAVSAKGKGFGFEAELGLSESHHEEKQREQESYESGTYLNQVRYSYVPTALCEFDTKELRLCETVIEELKGLERLINATENEKVIQTKSEGFLETYGSHVNVGSIEFGGVYTWQATCSNRRVSNKEKVHNMVKDALSGFVSMSYSEFGVTAGGSVSGDKVKDHADLSASYDDSELSTVTLSVSKRGGPQEAMSLPMWKMGLLRNNSTWAIIDRGSARRDFMGIWEFIRNSSSEFADARKLAETLQRTWHSITDSKSEICKRIDNIESIITSMKIFLDCVPRWTLDHLLSERAVGYLRELSEKVDECCQVTGDSQFWAGILKTNKDVSDFLTRVMDVQDDYPPAALVHVQYEMQRLIKASQSHDFPLRNVIEAWVSPSLEVEYQPSMMRKGIQDIPLFISAIKDTLLPQMQMSHAKGKAEVDIDCQSTKDLALAIIHVCNELKRMNDYYAVSLLQGPLCEMHFNPENKCFDVLVTEQSVTSFVDSLENHWQEFCSLRQAATLEELQAFLIQCFVHSTSKISEDPNQRKTKICQFLKGIEHLLVTEIKSRVEELLACSPPKLRILEQLSDEMTNEETSEETQLDRILYLDDEPVQERVQCTKPSLNSSGGKLLEQLGLVEHYPSKISLQDVMAVQNRSHKSQCDLPWLILQKLIMLDFKGRESDLSKAILTDKEHDSEESKEGFTFDDFLENIASEEDVDNVLSPLDIFITIYACCNMVLKQILAQKMFLCRLAIPFISPQLCDEGLLYSLWALRSIVIEWKNKDQVCMETSVVSQPVKTVSFLKLGKPPSSKSALLNNVISDQPHHTFWNRECPLGESEHPVANGLVEAQWYLPSGLPEDIFDDVTMFLNLRGDACAHKRQLQVLENISNAVVCCVDPADLESSVVRDTMKRIHESSAKVVLLLQMKELNLQNVQKQFESYFNFVGISYKGTTRIISGIKGNKVRTMEDLKQEVRKSLKILLDQSGQSIENGSTQANAAGINIDEEDKHCKTGKELAAEVISYVHQKSMDECKKNMLPLQGEYWEKWSKLLKAQRTAGGEEKQLNTIQGIAKIEEQMKLLRKDQFKICQNLSPLIETFLKNMLKVRDSPTATLYLQWLKIYLDEISRKTLPELHRQYHEKWKEVKLSENKSIQSSEMPTNYQKPDKAVLRKQLAVLEKTLAESSLGVEHLLREVGQIYEAAHETKPESIKDSVQKLPEVVAKLLLNGQPMEIMDGDAANVPLTWVEAVFSSLAGLVGDKKLFVISVLGIQSSGKSTLLNAMFGLQFAVSAGRCTRGVYMQLIRVDKGRSDLPYDYVMVVDTEGLRAPELGQLKHNNDNQLATFVIGLGDVTILNIKGENLSDISDVLQIAVHAFLRMKLSVNNFQTHRSCFFIHQNVPAINAKSKMQQGCKVVQEKLDEMTVEACIMENIIDIHSFNQVIKFDSETNVWHFSDLWYGDPPMAPINPGYTTKVQEVRDHLLDHLVQKGATFLTISDVSTHIKDLWQAVLSENFVFSFRNSLAAKAYNGLERTYNEKSWTVESNITEWLTQTAAVQLERCRTKKELDTKHSELMIVLEKMGSDLQEKACGELEDYIDSHNLKHIIIDWKVQKMNGLQIDINSSIETAREKLLFQKENVRIQLLQKVKLAGIDAEIMQKARDFANEKKGQKPNDADLTDMFERFWIKAVAELTPRCTESTIPVFTTVEQILYKHLTKDKTLLREELMKVSTYPIPVSLEHGITLDFIEGSDLSINRSFLKTCRHYLGDKDDVHHCRQEALKVINSILREVHIYLSDISRKDSDFEEAYATNVLKIVSDGVDMQNMTSKEKNSFTLRPQLMVKIVVSASRYASTVFEQMRHDYSEEHSIKKKLNTKKDAAWKLFKNMINQSTDEVITADLLADHMEKLVQQAVRKEIPLNIRKEMLPYLGFQKYSLLIKILGDLTEGGFDDYKVFLKSPKSFALQWITTVTIKEIFQTESGGKSKYATFVEREIDKLAKSIAKGIRETTAVVTKQNNPDIRMWLKQFSNPNTVKELPVSQRDLEYVTVQDVKDLENLEKLLMERLSSIENNVLEAFKAETPQSMKWEGSTPYQDILDKLWGCEACCPYCGEICQRSEKNHLSPNDCHQCIQHRPDGINGLRWKKDGRLTLESCNFNVQSDITFHGSESYPFKKYKSHEPDWDIAPSCNMESSKYWMWFMAKYKGLLTTWHNAVTPDIPNSWEQISKEEALDSLRVYQG